MGGEGKKEDYEESSRLTVGRSEKKSPQLSNDRKIDRPSKRNSSETGVFEIFQEFPIQFRWTVKMLLQLYKTKGFIRY